MSVSIKSPTSTTGSIQLNASDAITIDSSSNITVPNNLTVTGTVTQTGGATFNGGISGNVNFDSGTLYVDATNNNVGIGTNSPTISSGNGVHINGATAGPSVLHMTTGNQGTTSSDGLDITFGAGDVSFWNYETGVMKFATSNTERMHIDSSGYVGINGASNNRAQLEVRAGTSTIHQLFLEQNNTEHGWQFYADQTDGGLAFFRRNNSGQTERMRIKDDGRVLVGHTNPLSSGKFQTYANSGHVNQVYYDYSSGTGYFIEFLRTTGGFASVAAVVGNITASTTTTSYNTSSDYRLKENVTPMSGSINRLKQLKPSTWSWVQDGSHGEGFLAHEAQAVVPEAITGTKDAVDDEGNPVYQVIDQAKLVPLLTSALQEAITKIEDLETRIQALENPNG